MRRWVFFSLILCHLAGFLSAEIPEPPALLLTSKENGIQPETVFACNGMIYGYVTLAKAALGKHVLEALWTDPKHRIVQHSRDEVTFDPPGRRRARVWLQFTKEGRLWNPFSVQDAADPDREAYDGRWTLEVRWDDKTLATAPFDIRCR